MSKTIKNILIPYPNEGVIRSSQINDTVCPENSVQLAVNMNFDRVGAVQTRPGLTTAVADLASGVLSLGTLNIQTTSVRRLFAQTWNGSTTHTIWAHNGTSWSSVRTMANVLPTVARYTQWLGYTYMCNGINAVMASNGGNFTAVAGIVPASFPVVDYIHGGFEGRLWGVVSATDSLYYSNIVAFDPNTGVSTVTFALANFINISPLDGETITGVMRVPKALLVFKQNSIYRVYSASNVDSYPAYNVGTYSQESIIRAKDGIYFHHSSGFYKFAFDGQPVEISRRVSDFVKAIPRSYYSKVTGIWDGFDAVKWSIGPVTVEGVSYTNCMLRYTISTQVWTVYDYPTNVINAMIRYDNGTTVDQVMGTSLGKLNTMDSGYTDLTEDIYYDLVDRYRSFTDMYSKSKSISGATIITENAAGARLEYRHEKSPPNVWTYLDSVKDNYDALMPNVTTEDFNSVQLRLTGRTSGTPIIVHGIELLALQDKGLNEN
jgi:hypothetical protein